jgi:hypothetical protein
VNSGYAPTQPMPGSMEAAERAIAFFVYPTIGPDDIDDIAAAVKKVMAVACR